MVLTGQREPRDPAGRTEAPVPQVHLGQQVHPAPRALRVLLGSMGSQVKPEKPGLPVLMAKMVVEAQLVPRA